MAKIKLKFTFLFIFLLIFILFTSITKNASFQKKNPFAYVRVFAELAVFDDYVDVSIQNESNISQKVFVTKRDDKKDFFRYIEKTYHQTYMGQEGSGYLFSGETSSLAIESETFFKYYTIWKFRV